MTKYFVAVLGLILLLANVQAEPTIITVRVLSKDAKFIGSGMGGARVVLQDADSGLVLAEGIIQGSTGDTRKIMIEPRIRGQALSTKGSASFTATLQLDRPTKVQVTVEGPLNNSDSANRVTSTQWVIPGKHITGGDGWLLEIPGFSVTAEASLKAISNSESMIFDVRADITMMCGCPIEPDGLWDANGYEVAAIVTDRAGNSTTVPMHYAGKTSIFSGRSELAGGGPFEAVVYAYDASNGNTGVDIVRFGGPE
jgi:hypothetical protein